MEQPKRKRPAKTSGLVLLLAQVNFGAALAQTYDQTIGTNQTATVNLVKPGTTVLIAPGVSVTSASGPGISGAVGDTWAITNQGTVSAMGDMAIRLQGAGSSVVNDGIIGIGTTPSYGVNASAGLTLANHTGATISASSFAVYTSDVLQLTNQGSIINATRAIYASTPNNGLGADITNSGLIRGSAQGITLTTGSNGNATNVIRNMAGGQILATAPTGDAINLLHAVNTVTNDAGATIDGGHSGIFGSDLFTEVNVTNAGIIRGGTGAAVYTYGGGTINNLAGGSIVGAGGVSFPRAVVNDTDIVINAGTITANAPAFIGSNGAAAGSGAGIYFGGVYAPVGGLVNNLATGRIEGTIYGIYSGAALVPTDAGPINVTNAGTISGQTGLALNGANETVTNTGTITGTNGTAIQFDPTGVFRNTLTLGTGSVLNGNVLGGPGTDTLILTGSGEEDGTKIRNFETASMQGTAWTLTGTTALSSSAGITSGRLAINGNLASPSVTVQPAGTVAGTGTITGNVVNNGAIAPGDASAPGTLNIQGNLSLGSGSALNYRLGQAGAIGGALNDLLVVSGDLVLDGTVNVTRSTGGTFGAGIYRLINYGGSLTDNALALGSVPPGSDNTIQTAIPGQVNLINAANLLLNYWDGDAGPKFNSVIDGGNGTWQTSAGNDNWTNASGAINAGFSDGAFAIFAGSPGRVTVDNSLGAVTVSGMQFATSGYRIEGDPITLADGINTIRVGDGTSEGAAYTAEIAAVLIGSGGLTKTDLGTLILSSASTFTGTTDIAEGMLIVGDTSQAGLASSIAGAGVIVQSGAALGGYGQVLTSVVNNGSVYAGNATPSLEAGPLGHLRIAGDLQNDGLVSLAGAARGNTLVVAGDYSDPVGSLVVGTKLDGVGSLGSQQTDRLLIEGNATGSTAVDVLGTLESNGLGGVLQGAALVSRSTEGISIIQVGGTSAVNNFYLRNGYAALGPYRYELFAYAPGNSASSQRAVPGSGSSFWDYRLQVGLVCEDADCSGGDDDTGNGGGDGTNANGANGQRTAPADTPIDGRPSNTDDTGHRSVRPALVPQMPAYLVAPTALLGYGLRQIGNLHDRLGDVRAGLHGSDVATNATELFARGLGNDTTYRSDIDFADFGFGYDQRMTGVQIGGNWLGHDGDASSWRLGAALTQAHDRIEPHAPDGRSVLKYDATNIALTGTWLHQAGWYVDAVVSRDIYQGSVLTYAEVSEPNAHGWSASLEGGRSFTDSHEVVWEPQAQVVWQSLGGMAYSDQDGLRVRTEIPDQWTGRVGLRVSRAFQDADSQGVTAPFARVNYIYASQDHATTRVNGGLGDAQLQFGSGALGQSTQLELGVTRSLGGRLFLYVNGYYQWYLKGSGTEGWGGVAGLRWTL